MMRWTHLAPLMCLGCSAPEVEPTAPSPPDPFAERRPPRSQPELPDGEEPPAGDAAAAGDTPVAADVPPADRVPTEADIAAAVEEPPPSEDDIANAENAPPIPAGPVELPAVAPEDLPPPTPPYTGWSLSAPLALTGPGGATLTTIDRAGVRMEVLSSSGDRLNVQCSGCTGEWRDAGGWVSADAIYPAGRAAPAAHPLAPALALRAGWARGDGLPEGAARGALCRLVDLGFTQEGDVATWAQDDGQLTVQKTGERWEVTDLRAPSEDGWRCRVTRSDDTGDREVAPR